ncbi:MAG: translation initiation factor 2 [Desulfovibrio sp.]|nr:translation initiation factor 2 [Desulfovibrio sp.]
MYKSLLSVGLGLLLLAGCAATETPVSETTTGGEEAVVEQSNKAVASNTESVKGKKSESTIRQELDETAQKLLSRAARTITPSKNNKSVQKVGKEFVATYVSIDPKAYSTEMRPSTQAGQYNGFIRYSEQTYQCRGKSKAEALAAPCVPHSSKRMNEMIHYDGRQWHY